MNPIDDQLNRLFRAAAKVDGPVPADLTPPFGMETRMLAAWRDRGAVEFWDTRLLVRGLILAAAIMTISLWPVLNDSKSPASEYLAMTDSTVSIDNTTP